MAKNLTISEQTAKLSDQERGKLSGFAHQLYKSFKESWDSDGERRVARVKVVADILRTYPAATAAFIVALMPFPASENAPENGVFKASTTGAIGRYLQMARAQLVGHKGKKISEKELHSVLRSQGEESVIGTLRKEMKVLAPAKKRASAPKGGTLTGTKAEQSGVSKLQEWTNSIVNFKAKYGLVPAFARDVTSLYRAAEALYKDFGAMMERRDKDVPVQKQAAGASKAA